MTERHDRCRQDVSHFPVAVPAGQRAFSLVEVVVSILILGILAVGAFVAFQVSLGQVSEVTHNAKALELADARMELILGWKKTYGFDSVQDPCSANPSLAVCTVSLTGYVVNSTISDNWGGNTHFKEITVTVSGTGYATLTTMVADYE